MGTHDEHHDHHDHTAWDRPGDGIGFDRRPGRGRGMTRGRGRRGEGFGAWGPGPWGDFPLGGPGGFRGGRGRGARANRGDIRFGILTLLAEEPMHGYQIMQELTTRSGGVWRPSPGSIYPTLSALEDVGLVRAEQRDGKRVFELTDEGRAEVAQAGDRPAPWDEVAEGTDDALVALRNELGRVAAATMQIAKMGTTAQAEQARTLLTDTRKKLYLLLAEDAPS